VKKASSAESSSLTESAFSTTGTPRSRAIWMTESRVIPSRMSDSRPGVKIFPPRTRKTFSPVPSATNPFWSSRIASS